MMVTVGSYQGLCNMYRVFFSFDHRTLSAKVRGGWCRRSHRGSPNNRQQGILKLGNSTQLASQGHNF
jgi:hypothetical protein